MRLNHISEIGMKILALLLLLLSVVLNVYVYGSFGYGFGSMEGEYCRVVVVRQLLKNYIAFCKKKKRT